MWQKNVCLLVGKLNVLLCLVQTANNAVVQTTTTEPVKSTNYSKS